MKILMIVENSLGVMKKYQSSREKEKDVKTRAKRY